MLAGAAVLLSLGGASRTDRGVEAQRWMDQKPDSLKFGLTRRVARYWALGWSCRRIAETLRVSRSTVSNIIRSEEGRAAIEEIEALKFDRVTAFIATTGMRAVRTLDRARREGTRDDVVKIQASADLLNAAVKLIGHRRKNRGPKVSASNQVQFIRFADAAPPEEPSPEPPSSSEPSPS